MMAAPRVLKIMSAISWAAPQMPIKVAARFTNQAAVYRDCRAIGYAVVASIYHAAFKIN